VRGMERLLARLRSLSGRERILLSLCAVSVLVFALVRWGFHPAMDAYRKNLAEIRSRRNTLALYGAAASREGDVTAALANARERLGKLEEGILPGETPSAAEVYLQGALKPLIDRSDTRLTTVRGLTSTAKGRYTEVAVQVDLQTTTEGLAEILSGISRNGKFLRSKKLTVRSSHFARAPMDRKETLSVSLVVTGLVRTESDGKPEGTGKGKEG